jgi:hypothetical protein
VYAFTFIMAAIGLALMFLLPGGSASKYSYKAEEETSDQEKASPEAQEPQSAALFD